MEENPALVKIANKVLQHMYRQLLILVLVEKLISIYPKDMRDEFHGKENVLSKYKESKVVYLTSLLLHER